MEHSERCIAYLGPTGTFSEEAVHVYGATIGGVYTMLPCPSFPEVVHMVESGAATDAMLPFENSLEGAVSANLDILIHQTPLRIRGEVILPVRQFLWAAKGTEIAQVRRVVSHPQALGQCRRYLEQLRPGIATVAALSTAGAVEAVVREGATDAAAIAGPRAGAVYGAILLAPDIQDEPRNFTRFIALGETDAPPTGRDKTTLVFTVPQNVPGSLQAGLAELAHYGIQLFHIESRPQRERMGEYYFLIEFEGHRKDATVIEALDRLRARTDTVTVLGSYPAASLPD